MVTKDIFGALTVVDDTSMHPTVVDDTPTSPSQQDEKTRKMVEEALFFGEDKQGKSRQEIVEKRIKARIDEKRLIIKNFLEILDGIRKIEGIDSDQKLVYEAFIRKTLSDTLPEFQDKKAQSINIQEKEESMSQSLLQRIRRRFLRLLGLGNEVAVIQGDEGEDISFPDGFPESLEDSYEDWRKNCNTYTMLGTSEVLAAEEAKKVAEKVGKIQKAILSERIVLEK